MLSKKSVASSLESSCNPSSSEPASSSASESSSSAERAEKRLNRVGRPEKAPPRGKQLSPLVSRCWPFLTKVSLEELFQPSCYLPGCISCCKESEHDFFNRIESWKIKISCSGSVSWNLYCSTSMCMHVVIHLDPSQESLTIQTLHHNTSRE